jgi:hypothetical protein
MILERLIDEVVLLQSMHDHDDSRSLMGLDLVGCRIEILQDSDLGQ